MTKVLSISLLDCNQLHLKEFITTLQSLNITHLHIDLGDTSFIPNITFGIPLILEILKYDFIFDIHFMINKPLPIIKQFCKEFRNCYLTVHYEIPEFKETMEYLIMNKKIYNWFVCVAMKPETTKGMTKDLISNDFLFSGIDRVLILMVEPGFGGQKMIESCIESIGIFTCEVGVDGGVNDMTIGKVRGADYFVIGSHFVKSVNKKECLEELRRMLNKGK